MVPLVKRLKPRVPKRPSIRMEREWARLCGGAVVAGVDEAGRGPLAGPVVAAAVIFPFDGRRPSGLRDSKQLSPRERDRLFRAVCRTSISHGIGMASAEEVDALNILEATRLAARRALSMLEPLPGALITDYLEIPGDPRPTLSLVKGDAISLSVAAASVLAKVTRDRLMDLYAEEFPEYGWASNRGYPTPDHYAALEAHGPCTLHRLTFSGVSFFHAEPRRSPSHARLCRALAEEGPTETVGELIMQSEKRLPPPDFRDLLVRFKGVGP